jgi:hypothetical protein
MHLSDLKLSDAASRGVLRDPDAPAALVYGAARTLLGPEVDEFDPEAARACFSHFHSIELPRVNDDKIWAVASLRTTPQGATESAQIFESVCLALSGEPVVTGIFQDPDPPCMAWGAQHIVHLLQDFHADARDVRPQDMWGREVCSFVGAILFDRGYLVAPLSLVFAQPDLDEETGQGAQAAKIAKKWRTMRASNKRLEDLQLTEVPDQIQLARLASCELYIQEHQTQFIDSVRAHLSDS